MRLPDPIANTTTEAYLAYKAGVLAEGDLKPKLYEPYIHLDAWLAYWTGLTDTYPVKGVGKNLFDYAGHFHGDGYNGVEASLDRETGEITVSGKPTTSWQQVVKLYDITDLLEDGETYTLSQSSYDNKLYLQVNAYNTGATPTYLYSYSGPTTFTVDKTAYPKYTVSVQIGDKGNWSSETTTITRTFQIEKGSTATAFEPYAGKPEMLTDEEAYIAYLSGVTDTYPQEFRDPADIRVAAYLRYLISARFGRPEYPVTNEELYLSMLKTQYIPSGDPSSDIVIDGTAKAPFQDVKMYGDTEQQEYTGKNLLQFIPQSSQGMTVTYDAKTGLAHVSGTNSSSDGMWANISVSVECSIPAGTYTLSVTEAQSNLDFHIRLRYADDSNGDFSISRNNTSKTFEMPKEAKRVYIWCGGLTPKYSSVDFTVGIQLEAGSEATSFEPYVGGVPSPNPDYPQPIQTVTGEQTVEIVGKNLFDKSTDTIAKYLDASGNIVSGGTWSISGYIAVKPGENYTISGVGTPGILPRYCFYNSSKQFVSAVITGNQTVTVPSGANYIRLSIYNGTNGQYPNDENTLQLELGSTASSYAPYHATSYPLDLSGTIELDMSQATRLDAYINGSGVIVSSGANALFGIAVEPNTTYTITKIASSRFRYVCTSTTPAIGATVGTTTNNDSATSVTVTTGANDTYLVCTYWSNTSTSTKDDVFNSVKITTRASIELCKLGDYQDYIYKDGESWKVHKAISRITLDGTEGWVYADNYNYARCPSYIFVDKPLGGTGLGSQLSNYFRVITDWGSFRDSTNRNAFFALLDEGYKISIRNTGCTSVEDYKSWLSANKPSFYYPVETPTDTTITDQTLIAQLEALVNGGAEDGTTYIKVNATDPNLPGLLYVEAPKYD